MIIESQYIKLKLDTFLFNAGILGFIDVIIAQGAIKNEDFQYEKDTLLVKKEFLLKADLAQGFIDTAINKFKETAAIERALNDIKYILSLDNIEDEEKAKLFETKRKNVIARFTQASIVTGLKTLQEKGIEHAIDENIVNLKKEKDFIEIKKYLKEIYNYCQHPKIYQTLLMKNIIYTQIRMIWDGIAFLNKLESAKEIKESYERVFVLPLIKNINFTPNSRSKKTCSNCHELSDELNAMSYLNDIGLDVNRKKSAYWNQKADLQICGICNFVYSCAPLGFNLFGNDMVLVNSNHTITGLKSINSKEHSSEEKSYRYRLITKKILDEIKEKEHEFNNIEIIIRHKDDKRDYYSLDIISADLIKVFQACRQEIGFIAGKFVKISDKMYLNVSEEVLNYLFLRKSLYNLIYKLLKCDGNKEYLFDILKIEIKRKKLKEEMKLKADELKFAYVMHKFGVDIKRKVYATSNNENKLIGLALKLENALRTNNQNLFFDILLKLYGGLNMDIPNLFIEAMSEEKFRELGTAFVLGLKGETKENKKEGEKNE